MIFVGALINSRFGGGGLEWTEAYPPAVLYGDDPDAVERQVVVERVVEVLRPDVTLVDVALDARFFDAARF